MSQETVQSRALAAFHAGRRRETVKLIIDEGAAILGDPLMQQLLALARSNPVDEHALLEAAAYDPTAPDPEAFFNLGVHEQGLGNDARALLSYAQALRLQPDHAGALNNLGDLLRRAHRSDEAWLAVERYIATGADVRGLEIRFAKIADGCNRPGKAEKWFKQASRHDPDNPSIAWEWAMQLLRDEKFAAGWQGFEARRSLFSHSSLAIVNYAAPEWEGGALEGKALLVHKEQGLGDTIMFASCLPDIARSAEVLHIAVQPPLARLMRANFPAALVWPSASVPGLEDEVHQRWRDLAGEIDFQIPFGSLPLHLRSQGFPAPAAYMSASAADTDKWHSRIAALAPGGGGNLRAGLVISARRDGEIGAGIAEGPPKCLPPILAGGLSTPGIDWLGLHDRSTAEDLAAIPGLDIIDTSAWLYDLADTAGLIENLDVVVAVDTAVAHLAGAMGKKVFLLVRRHSDWRWGRSRSDSYWYPDVRLFRQAHEGDWAPVVAEVADALAKLVQKRKDGARRTAPTASDNPDEVVS